MNSLPGLQGSPRSNGSARMSGREEYMRSMHSSTSAFICRKSAEIRMDTTSWRNSSNVKKFGWMFLMVPLVLFFDHVLNHNSGTPDCGLFVLHSNRTSETTEPVLDFGKAMAQLQHSLVSKVATCREPSIYSANHSKTSRRDVSKGGFWSQWISKLWISMDDLLL